MADKRIYEVPSVDAVVGINKIPLSVGDGTAATITLNTLKNYVKSNLNLATTDITDYPTFSTINGQSITNGGNINVTADSVDWDDINDRPAFAPVATTNNYEDLENRPNFSTINHHRIDEGGDIEIEATNVDWTNISNKPNFATINQQPITNGGNINVTASSVSWSNVTGKPTIPTNVSQLTNDLQFISEPEVKYLEGAEIQWEAEPNILFVCEEEVGNLMIMDWDVNNVLPSTIYFTAMQNFFLTSVPELRFICNGRHFVPEETEFIAGETYKITLQLGFATIEGFFE